MARRIMAGAGCLVLGAALGATCKLSADYIRQAPAFTIKEVIVNTGKHVSREDVVKLSGIRPGRNIFSFHLAEAIRGVKFHPWVKSVSMRRQLPDRVLIELEERTPIAIVAMDSLYYLDEDLEIFKKVVPPDSLDFPVITGLFLQEVIENEPELAGELKKAAEILDMAARSRVLPAEDISEIHLDRTFGIELVTSKSAVLIKLGEGELQKKWQELERVVVELDADLEKVAVLDLNCQGRVTARLKSGYQLAREEGAMFLRQ
jgi:cell division protein FtsQ